MPATKKPFKIPSTLSSQPCNATPGYVPLNTKVLPRRKLVVLLCGSGLQSLAQASVLSWQTLRADSAAPSHRLPWPCKTTERP